MRKSLMLAGLLGLALLVACGGSPSAMPRTPVANVTGTWHLDFTATSGSYSGYFRQAELTLAGNDVSGRGIRHPGGSPCGDVTGSLVGNRLELTVEITSANCAGTPNPTPQSDLGTIEITATVTGTGDMLTITGAFTYDPEDESLAEVSGSVAGQNYLLPETLTRTWGDFSI